MPNHRNMHHKHKIAVTLAFLVLLTAFSIGLVERFGLYDEGIIASDLVGKAPDSVNPVDFNPVLSFDKDSRII